jgi:hypothetical protein
MQRPSPAQKENMDQNSLETAHRIFYYQQQELEKVRKAKQKQAGKIKQLSRLHQALKTENDQLHRR